MSNPDSFIQEVTEEVRRDRLYGYVRRYGWIAVLLVLLVVGGAAFNEWRKARAEAEAQAFGDAVLEALGTGTPEARRAALAGIDAAGARSGILALLQAAEAQRAGDREAALAAFAAVEADNALPQSYRQLAALKRVMLAGAELPNDERQAVLSGLAQPDMPFRPLAMEQLALLRIEAGETAAALEILRDILDEPEVTEDLRARVRQVMVALGGDPAAAG
ncbi:hypothetical protein [Rhodobaculum claviforme]|uniref:Tetratricopeptide repeat-like domain-containing protein n=1 Tax=Rhodobaculum claviforme TaxID=1549854 RepID=A0A934THG8_9RHOB|nr:hypothetical protein [Rhodobaculum claviforme]MBK5926405.1 hypothetical protein [Rhodobaculum claviforme]